MSYTIAEATPQQAQQALALFPRLAAFDIPESRVAEHLWQGDAELLKGWIAGDLPEAMVLVAAAGDDILGLAFARLRPELLSHQPSAHLEVLVVAAGAQGQGVGTALMNAIERAAFQRGAQSLTLHVFARNQRARKLYQKMGYDEELLRCTKPLP